MVEAPTAACVFPRAFPKEVSVGLPDSLSIEEVKSE